MLYKKRIILLLSVLIMCCLTEKTDSQNLILNKVKNSKWCLIVGEDCISYFIFKRDSSYIEYSCESNDTFTGRYTIKRDTILAIVKFIGKDSCVMGVPTDKLIIFERKLFRVYQRHDSYSFKACYNPKIFYNLDTTYGKKIK